MARSRMRSKVQGRRKANPWMLATIVLVIVILAVGVVVVQGLCCKDTFQQAITSPEQVQRITPADAKALLDKGMAVLYDTRSDEAYQAKHAVGALSFPEAEQETLVDVLPADRALIFY